MRIRTIKYLAVISLALLTSCTLLSAGSHSKTDNSDGEVDPNFENGIYINNHIQHPDKSFFTFINMRLFGDHVWADPASEAHLIPTTKLNPRDLRQPKTDSNQTTQTSDAKNTLRQVTWLGHSTFLIQYDGVSVLTDPVFSDRASPVSFAGPKRYTPVATSIDNLPNIDIVIISHNHYDHLDESSIKQLGNYPHYFVPSGLKEWFTDLGVNSNKVTEMRWWQSSTHSNANITATPSQHWSARGLGDRHHSHWASWFISIGDFDFWFAGDTGYNDKDFVSIGEHISQQDKALDLALIPIGAYGPRDFMKTYHVNTEEAVKIHKEVKSQYSIGMHWGTFPLTSERPMEPYEWLRKLTKIGDVGDAPFETLKIGEVKQL